MEHPLIHEFVRSWIFMAVPLALGAFLAMGYSAAHRPVQGIVVGGLFAGMLIVCAQTLY